MLDKLALSVLAGAIAWACKRPLGRLWHRLGGWNLWGGEQ